MATVERTIPSSQAVTLDGVVLARGNEVALEVERVTFPAGAVTALIGPNGSGKSTLLHAVAGLLDPRAGDVWVLGEAPARARRRVAYVLQAVAVTEHLPITVREVVAMGRYPGTGLLRRFSAEDRALVEEAIERLELTGLERRHLGELSGGQRQRALVAQALAQDADVLLLDEPVTGLDLASSDRIRSVIEAERAAGRVVVVATHDLDEARRADQVVLLAGRVVAAGPPAAALTADTLRAAYGGRLLRLDDGVLLVDDGAHHEHHHPGAAEDPGSHDHHAGHPH